MAYITPLGTWVDCFISDCYDLLWLIDRLQVLGFVPFMVGHHSTHALEILGCLEAHNTYQRQANDQNPQSDDLG